MPEKFPFIGPSYKTRSVAFDAQRCINLYPVVSESKTSKNIVGLQGTPGLEVFSTLATSISRGGHNALGRAFFVNGDKLVEVFSDGTKTVQGTLLTSQGFVSLADNGTQVCLVDGPNGYIFTLATNVFVQITSTGWMGADTVTYIDGYFLFNKPDTGIYYISAINDGSSIDSLDFASAEGSPDNLVAVMAVHKEVWLFGTNSIEIVFDSGDVDFPFQRIQGAFIEYGCAAPGSVAKTANTVFWLGQDDQGSGVIWTASGYQPQRISTFAVEYAIQQYADITDAVGYTYQEDGHYFYVLNFTSASTTWVFDIGLQQWHERAYFNLDTGSYERHRGQCHVFAFGKHLLGDYVNGNIYNQSLGLYNDAGNPKRWERTAPHLAGNLNYIYFSRFQLDMQTGTGLVTGGIADTDPQVMLQWSDDGAHTWSNEYWVSAGKIGEYTARALWRRLGRSRDRVWRVAGMSATPVFLINGLVEATQGGN